MSKANTQISSSTNAKRNVTLPDSSNCPICQGTGFYRLDLPLDHPEFGKIHVCECRQSEINLQAKERLFSLSQLNELSNHTFENFEPRGQFGLWPQQADSLERAYNQARQYAASQKGWLVLQGGPGCGKTHLAAAIANFAVSLGVPTLFITTPDLLDSLRFAYNSTETSFEQRFDDIRKAKLLIMDDFGTQNATDWAQEKLFQIINYRYTNHLPTVITTNLLGQEIEERITSRLNDPELVTRAKIEAPDFRRPDRDIGYHKLSSLDLLHKCTFANFNLRKEEGLTKGEQQSLEKAFNACKKYAQKPHGWLLLIGPYGSGKTHLAAAIANYRADSKAPPLFVVVPDLMDHLRATFNPNSSVSLDQRFEEVRYAPLLILDDLGTQSSSPWVKEKLYQLFNLRYNAELPTVITSASDLSEIDPRLRSRFLDRRLCTIYGLTAPPYTGDETLSQSTTKRTKKIS